MGAGTSFRVRQSEHHAYEVCGFRTSQNINTKYKKYLKRNITTQSTDKRRQKDNLRPHHKQNPKWKKKYITRPPNRQQNSNKFQLKWNKQHIFSDFVFRMDNKQTNHDRPKTRPFAKDEFPAVHLPFCIRNQTSRIEFYLPVCVQRRRNFMVTVTSAQQLYRMAFDGTTFEMFFAIFPFWFSWWHIESITSSGKIIICLCRNDLRTIVSKSSTRKT